MEYKKIGIILINYKDYAKRFLADCRDSLRALDYPKNKYQVYIVDNATSFETQNYFKTEYPEAIIIPNQTNSGWGGGNNLGVECALKNNCEDVVLLNMDTIVDKDWLKGLTEAARNDPGVGIVQSKLLLHPVGADGMQRINSLGNEIHFLGFGFCHGYGDPDVNDQRSMVNGQLTGISYASGASMYVKGEVFKKIGLCNPEFFMYHDDLEFCLKAKLAGYRVVLASRSIAWHKYDFQRSTQRIYFMERNRWMMLFEFYKIPSLILISPALILIEMGLIGASILNGYSAAKLRSCGYFLKRNHWKKIISERRNIQNMRQLSDKNMMKDFTGTIDFQEIMNPLVAYVVNPLMNFYWQIARRVIFW